MLPQYGLRATLAGADHNDGYCEDEREHRQLNPRQSREHGKPDECQLSLVRGLGERPGCGVHSGEYEGIRERLRGDVRGVDEVGHERGQRRNGECDARAQAQSAGQKVDGYRGERHRQRSDRLHDAIGEGDIAQEPGGGGDERLQEGREMSGTAADQRTTRLGERTTERRIDVFVGKEGRRRP